MIKLLAKVSIFLTNLEKKYLKKYGVKCYKTYSICGGSSECDWNVSYCGCEQRNIFRRTAKSIGNIIWKLENHNGS